MPTSYSEFLDQFDRYVNLEKRRRIIYLPSPDGPSFLLHYQSHEDFDQAVLSLLLAAYARTFDCEFVLRSIGYGTYQVSYTVVAKTKEEAKAIARHMSNSRRIATLTENAVSEEVVVHALDSGQTARALLRDMKTVLDDASSTTAEEAKAEINAIVSIAEADLGISSSDGKELPERLAKLDAVAVKSPPAKSSSYWRVGDAVGAVLGGLMKSLGAG